VLERQFIKLRAVATVPLIRMTEAEASEVLIESDLCRVEHRARLQHLDGRDITVRPDKVWH